MTAIRSTILLAAFLAFACVCPKAAEGAQPSAADEAVIKAQLPTYPLTTCVVTGEKLGGDMGTPVNYVYQGRLVRFCCGMCIKDFNKDPAKYLAMLDAAAKKADAPKDTGVKANAGAPPGGGCCR